MFSITCCWCQPLVLSLLKLNTPNFKQGHKVMLCCSHYQQHKITYLKNASQRHVWCHLRADCIQYNERSAEALCSTAGSVQWIKYQSNIAAVRSWSPTFVLCQATLPVEVREHTAQAPLPQAMHVKCASQRRTVKSRFTVESHMTNSRRQPRPNRCCRLCTDTLRSLM